MPSHSAGVPPSTPASGLPATQSRMQVISCSHAVAPASLTPAESGVAHPESGVQQFELMQLSQAALPVSAPTEQAPLSTVASGPPSTTTVPRAPVATSVAVASVAATSAVVTSMPASGVTSLPVSDVSTPLPPAQVL